MIRIETNRYLGTHGKQPKGTGNWAFIGPEGQIAWAPHTLTLTAAKCLLKKEIKTMGLADRYTVWQVAP